MAKNGRPTKYKKEYQEQAKKLAAIGATDAQVADFFNVTEQTINNWKTAHPQFFESLKLGKQVSDDKVVRSLFERATGYEHPEDKVFNNGGEALVIPTIKRYAPDPTSMIFWLKNRRPEEWRDKIVQEHEIPEGVTFNMSFGSGD